MRTLINPLASRAPWSESEARITSLAAAEAARREISRWPGYALTPVRSLDLIARESNLGQLLLKDESGRFGQGSFKSLGGAYAAELALRQTNAPSPATLCCATEGNHGRSVALAAKRLGCCAVIYMSEHALDYKAEAIEALGARVIRIAGTYDDAVRSAQAAAQAQGWVLVADTSDEADQTVYRVMQGYGVMALELLDHFAGREFPTHVFLQGGVGGLAAGVIGPLSEALGEQRPRFIIVEPQAAACLLESAMRFAPSRVAGALDTQMRLLAVGEASPAAWPVLQQRADAFIAIEDDAAVRAAARLNRAEGGRAALDVGITGAAGLAGVIEACACAAVAKVLELNAQARVLVLATEAGPPRR